MRAYDGFVNVSNECQVLVFSADGLAPVPFLSSFSRARDNPKVSTLL
jgi:hypothetical protein